MIHLSSPFQNLWDELTEDEIISIFGRKHVPNNLQNGKLNKTQKSGNPDFILRDEGLSHYSKWNWLHQLTCMEGKIRTKEESCNLFFFRECEQIKTLINFADQLPIKWLSNCQFERLLTTHNQQVEQRSKKFLLSSLHAKRR